jgi:prepilin-type N-terminal cleavage/methylation domain-containing protein
MNTSSRVPHNRVRAGFTLVEMIVSLGIFAVVAVVAAAALLRIVSDNNRAQSLQSAINVVSYALDAMSREMRTGTNFQCRTGFLDPSTPDWQTLPSQSCNITYPSPTISLAFLSSQTDPNNPACRLMYVYRFQQFTILMSGSRYATITKAQQSSCGQALTTADYYPVFDVGNLVSNIKLNDYRVSVQTSSSGYSWADIHLWGVAGTRAVDQTLFDVETAVSQRIHD